MNQLLSLDCEQKAFEKQKYWEAKASDAEKNGVHTPSIIPNVLKDVFKEEGGYRYEEQRNSCISIEQCFHGFQHSVECLGRT